MDFGDILNKWEQRQPQSNKQSNMETGLNNNEIIDKDANEQKKNIPGEKRRHLLNAKPDDILDIHGYTAEKAWISLEEFFQNAKSNDYEKLRIIHGKGNHTQGEAVLKNTVRKFIEQCGFAGESGYEKSNNGGSGATWVLLKIDK
ncbi:MAG: Smr/MutS family protein [Treponema sp.]|nr:Smr/MutS family protein [Treponema sp.]